MTLHEEQEKVQSAMKTALSGLQEDPWLTQRILANAKGEETVVKRVSATVIIAIALIVVAVTGALAAALGLFDQLSHDPRGDSRLSAVDQLQNPSAKSGQQKTASPSGLNRHIMREIVCSLRTG